MENVIYINNLYQKDNHQKLENRVRCGAYCKINALKQFCIFQSSIIYFDAVDWFTTKAKCNA